MIYNNIEDAVKASVTEIEEAAEKTLQDAGKFARDAALSTDLFHVGGNFRDKTQFHTLDRFNGFLLTDNDYAQFLEYGNNQKPFITPTNKKCLHFVVGGKDIFTKKVRTHGPLPYMSEAGDQLEEVIDKMFEENLNKTLT
jgi:hypothetical protein